MKKYLILFFAALAVGFQACDNNDDLWDAVDDLKSRVQALETQVRALNGNVEALQTLYSGATIRDFRETDDKFMLELTDGRTIDLVKGSEATAVIPVIGIDDEGFWRVSYDNGTSWETLPVKAAATDGRTPQFRISDLGYWEISYDGTAWDTVKDPAGQPVKAVGGDAVVTDKFFQKVEASADVFRIELLDGTVLDIPVLRDFYCRIVLTTPGVQTFDAGELRTFDVEIKGADNTVVTAPEGWTARLSEAVNDRAALNVQAPAAAPRAAADNTTDVSILATSGSYAVIAKIEVRSTGVAPVVTDYWETGYTVGGIKYDKHTAGAVLLTDGGSITAGGVYFLDPTDDTAVFTLPKLAAAELVVIGRYEGAQPRLTVSGIQSLNGASGTGYVFKNLDITAATANYVFNFGGTPGTYDQFVIEDCRLVQTVADKVLSYFNVAQSAIRNTTIRNSRIALTVSADGKATRVVNFNQANAAEIGSVTVENSIVYAPQFVANGALLTMPSGSAATTALDLRIENNTLVNFIGQPNGLLNLAGDRSLIMRKNIFWAADGYDVKAYLFRFYAVTEAPVMDVAENVFYGLHSPTAWAAYHTDSTFKTDETYPREATDPFAGGRFDPSAGTFVPGADYAAYGAKIE